MSSTKEQEIKLFLRKSIANLTGNKLLELQLLDEQLIQEVTMDSIQIINLIVQIELNYNIAFNDEELLFENFATLKVISERIMKKLSVSL